MMVKVCGITRRQDAEVAVEAGASALGFVFVPSSPRSIAPERAAEIGRGLPVLKVGVFVNESAASIEEMTRIAQLDIAQIYGGAAPTGARVWKAFRLTAAFDPALAHGAEAVLLDGPANGISFDWTLVRSNGAKIIVAGGLDASNVAEAIRTVKAWGVDASSRLESSPGIKDHDKVRRFVEAALKA
jgi:phosphoribosylanthranilate isomerase